MMKRGRKAEQRGGAGSRTYDAAFRARLFWALSDPEDQGALWFRVLGTVGLVENLGCCSLVLARKGLKKQRSSAGDLRIDLIDHLNSSVQKCFHQTVRMLQGSGKLVLNFEKKDMVEYMSWTVSRTEKWDPLQWSEWYPGLSSCIEQIVWDCHVPRCNHQVLLPGHIPRNVTA